MNSASQRLRLTLRSRRAVLRDVSVRWSSSGPSVLLQRDIPAPHCGSIRILTLNNEKTRNAISTRLLSELGRQVNDIHGQGPQGHTRALILASDVNSSFCAGADLKERAGFTTEQTQEFLTSLRSTFASFAALPIPTIAAVSSLALGGGLEMALCSHLRVFASTATVALPESRLGIIPGAGGTYRLSGLIGRTRALDLMLTGRRVGAAEAYFMGICDRLIPVQPEDDTGEGVAANAKEREASLLARARDDVLNAAIALSKEICEGGPVATRQLVQVLAGSRLLHESDVGSAVENEGYDGVIDTHDRNEALRAFKEKRKPVFKGH